MKLKYLLNLLAILGILSLLFFTLKEYLHSYMYIYDKLIKFYEFVPKLIILLLLITLVVDYNFQYLKVNLKFLVFIFIILISIAFFSIIDTLASTRGIILNTIDYEILTSKEVKDITLKIDSNLLLNILIFLTANIILLARIIYKIFNKNRNLYLTPLIILTIILDNLIGILIIFFYSKEVSIIESAIVLGLIPSSFDIKNSEVFEIFYSYIFMVIILSIFVFITNTYRILLEKEN